MIEYWLEKAETERMKNECLWLDDFEGFFAPSCSGADIGV
jgi:hypothetical protein